MLLSLGERVHGANRERERLSLQRSRDGQLKNGAKGKTDEKGEQTATTVMATNEIIEVKVWKKTK